MFQFQRLFFGLLLINLVAAYVGTSGKKKKTKQKSEFLGREARRREQGIKEGAERGSAILLGSGGGRG